MKKRVLSVILCISVFLCSFSVTAFASTGSTFAISILEWLVGEAVAFFTGASEDMFAEAVGEEKYEILLIFRDMCTTNKLSEDDFSQFLIDFASDYPDNDYMISEYGSQYTDCWNDIHHLISYAQNSCSLTIDQIVDFVFHTDTSDYKKTDEGIQIPGSALKQDIKDSTLTFYPTGNIGMVSWKNDVIFGASQFNEKRDKTQFTFFAGGTFFGVSDFYSGYAIPFYYNGETDDYYFSDFQLLLTTVTENAAINISRYPIDGYDVSKPLSSGALSLNTIDYPFWSFFYDTGFNQPVFKYFEDLRSYCQHMSSSAITSKGIIPHDIKFYCSSDITKSFQACLSILSSYDSFKNTLTCPYNFGFYISDKPIRMDGWAKDIDADKISDNDIITITGDTIYDYKITNSTTGDTNTITEYMNNNYTYITNNPGGNSGGSGGVGGNVTVGGNVNVSGNVNVGGDVNVKIDPIQFEPIQFDIPPIDINVNVSGGGSGSGSDSGDGNESPGDYIDPGEVNTSIDDYIQHIPEVSKGFIDYLKDFFSWLPKEIYGLLILGLLVAVFCRLNGR